MRWLSRLILVLSLALVPLLASLPASAARPTVHTDHVEGTNVPWTRCDGFEIVVNFTFDVVERTFYDKDGDPVRMQVQYQGEGELVNTVTGASNTGSSPSMDIVDVEAGTITTVGLYFHNNLPGEGIVALQAGRITFDLATGDVFFSAGPQPGFEGIDWCSILD